MFVKRIPPPAYQQEIETKKQVAQLLALYSIIKGSNPL